MAGVFFRDQAIALKDFGHKVGVICPTLLSLKDSFRNITYNKCTEYENDDGVHTYRKKVIAALPRVPYGNYFLLKKAARSLLKKYINENGKPDIIHAHSAILAGALAVGLSKEFGIPMVLTEHSSAFARNLYKRWQTKLAKKAAISASSCIAVSPSLGHLLTERLETNETHWKWIPNVVADRFREAANSDKRDRCLRFLNLALMTENKGQLDLINAFSTFFKSTVDAELWLAGDGPIRNQLEEKAKDLGIADKVKFIGLVEPSKVPELLESVDVMVVSSHYETFGMVAAEALMAGLPVIATRCGGPECIVEAGDGVLVAPKSPDELCIAMKAISESLTDYDPVAISERAKSRFSKEAVANMLTMEYEKVLASDCFNKTSF